MHRVEVRCKRYVKPEVYYCNEVQLSDDRLTLVMDGLGICYYPVEEIHLPVQVTPCARRVLTLAPGASHGVFVAGVRAIQ